MPWPRLWARSDLLEPWQRTWSYRVQAVVLSASWALMAGIAAGLLLRGLPYWEAPLAVAGAGVAARWLLEHDAKARFRSSGATPSYP